MKKGGRSFFFNALISLIVVEMKKLMNLFIVYIMLRFVIRYIREERFFFGCPLNLRKELPKNKNSSLKYIVLSQFD